MKNENEEKEGEPEPGKQGEERWKEVCEHWVHCIDGEVYEYSTHDRTQIEKYFSQDAEVLGWINEHPEEQFYLTLMIYPKKRAAQNAVGIWGVDVGNGMDNRGFEEDDFEGVLNFLNEL